MPSLFFIILFLCHSAFAESLADLEAIVAKSPSLDAFLADSARVDEYYTALSGYYGGAERLPRAHFDVLLKQLREVRQKVPDLAQRLWEPADTGKTFSITADWTSYGRSLDVAKWNGHYSALDKTLAAEADSLTTLDPKQARQAVAVAIARLDAEAAALVGGPRAREAFFRAKRADPELKAAAAYLALSKFRSEAFRDKIFSGDADLVLETMNEIRQNIRAEFAREGMSLGALTTLVQERIPTLAQLLDAKEAFPVTMRRTHRGAMVPVGRAGNSTFHFRPLPRRFHGIFKGIPLRECVGGGACLTLTPERWATIALAGTQFYHVEKEHALEGGEKSSEYLGFTQHVPLRHAKTSTVIGSTDFGAPALRNPKLYAAWVGEVTKHLPADWRGLAVGKLNHINNAGVLDTARADNSYALSDSLGRSDEWRHVDELARKVVRASPGDPHGYSGEMIFDGRGQREGIPLPSGGSIDIRTRTHTELRLLDPQWAAIAQHPERIADIAGEGDLSRAGRLAAHLARLAESDETLRRRLEAIPLYAPLLDWQRHDEQLADIGRRIGINRRTRVVRNLAGLLSATAATAMFSVPVLFKQPAGFLVFASGLAAGVMTVWTGFADAEYAVNTFPAHLGMLRAEAQIAGKRLGAVRARCRAALRTFNGDRTTP